MISYFLNYFSFQCNGLNKYFETKTSDIWWDILSNFHLSKYDNEIAPIDETIHK